MSGWLIPAFFFFKHIHVHAVWLLLFEMVPTVLGHQRRLHVLCSTVKLLLRRLIVNTSLTTRMFTWFVFGLHSLRLTPTTSLRQCATGCMTNTDVVTLITRGGLRCFVMGVLSPSTAWAALLMLISKFAGQRARGQEEHGGPG